MEDVEGIISSITAVEEDGWCGEPMLFCFVVDIVRARESRSILFICSSILKTFYATTGEESVRFQSLF